MTAGGRLALFIVAGCVSMNGAFVLPFGDTWTRLIVIISILGVIGRWASRGTAQRPTNASDLAFAAVSGVAMYAAAWVLTWLPPFAASIAFVSRWTAGHSTAALAMTLPLAVVGEELFWRATVMRLAMDQFGVAAGVLVATAAYALAHIASGWLLPFAAFSAGLVWAGLLLATRNLAPPIVSHFVFDALLLLIVPLV